MTQCYENQLALETKDKLVVKEKSRREVLLELLRYAGPGHNRLFQYPNREKYIVIMKDKPEYDDDTTDYFSKMDAARARSNQLLEDNFGSEGRDFFRGIYNDYNEFHCFLSEEEVKKIQGADEVVSVRPMDVCYYSSSDSESYKSEPEEEEQGSDDDESEPEEEEQEGSDDKSDSEKSQLMNSAAVEIANDVFKSSRQKEDDLLS